MEKKVNAKQAYLSAFEFLGDIYDQYEQDDLGILLRGMNLNSAGDSTDTEMKSIWLEVVNTRFAGQREYDLYESFELMLLFLANVNTNMHSKFLNELLIKLRENLNAESVLPDWEIAVDRAIDQLR